MKENEKQAVEEMAKVLYESDNKPSVFICGIEEVAEDLYNAGYRKQSEGEWKQTEEPMGWYDVNCVECSVCGECWVFNDSLDFDIIVEYWHYCPNCGAHMEGDENEQREAD